MNYLEHSSNTQLTSFDVTPHILEKHIIIPDQDSANHAIYQYCSNYDADENAIKDYIYRPSAQVTKITAIVPALISKSYSLKDGKLEKTSAGQLVRGKYQVIKIYDPPTLAQMLTGLSYNEALTYGVPRRPETHGSIASRNNAGPGELTRTQDCFDWPNGPAIFFNDYDHPLGAKPMTAEELWVKIIDICPVLATAPAVIIPSASGFIYNTNTDEELKGAGGWHVYILIADGRDIPRAGKILSEMAWLAGYGRFDISKSGALLERSLFDAAVWQPERIDFAAGSCCEPPLEQRRPDPFMINTTALPFDTRQLLAITATEDLERLKTSARAAVADEAKRVRAAWVDSRVNAEMQKTTESAPEKRESKIKQLRATYTRAAEDGHLQGDFTLIAEDGSKVTVGEILDKPEQWHNKRFSDPLDPEYHNDKRIARLNLQSGGKASLYSHAHGGCRYVLERVQQTVQIIAGDMPRIIALTQQHILGAGDVYQRGGELVRVADGLLLGIHQTWLKTHLETLCRFEIYKNNKQIQTDCPSELPQRIITNRGGWPFNEIIGVLNAPTLRQDGSLLDRPGYDKATKLLLLSDNNDKWQRIPLSPTPEEARDALIRLWDPFQHFPFVGPIDRAVALSAILTAPIRRTLPTAPGFGISAYQMGTGKTKFGQCCGILTNGQVPAVAPWADSTEEQRKTLMAAFLSGPGAVLLDNIEKVLSSSELCAAITGENYEDRRLGHSERVKASTRVLLMATGNNLRIADDLTRRILPVTLDHGVERPEILSFPFDPVARVAERWLTVRADALTILRAFVVAGKPANGLGDMGSFEVWNGLVRQCVVWLRDTDLAPFELADPADAVIRTIDADPDTQKLRNLLCCWWDNFQDKPTKVGELINACGGNGCVTNGITDLSETLLEIAGEGSNINRWRLGRWIEKHAKRQLDGKKIVEGGRSGGSRRWCVVKVSE
jgi:hypothetical protein